MPVERTSSGSLLITGDGIKVYQFLATKTAIQMYVNTGVKASRTFPTVRRMREIWNIPNVHTTWKSVLRVMEEREKLFEEGGMSDIRWLTHGEATTSS